MERAARFRLIPAVLFAVAFQVMFYTRTLPNSHPEPALRITRLGVMAWAVGYRFEGAPSLWSAAAARLSQLSHLRQRLPVFAAAAAVVIVALALGDLVRGLLLGRDNQSRTERLLVSFGLGMGGISLLTLFAGLSGLLTRVMVASVAAVVLVVWWVVRPGRRAGGAPGPESLPGLLTVRCVLVPAMCGFFLLEFLAASLPTPDYDALAYHLLGPKEWWRNGRIEFLPHNVYTTFPFLTEMFHLLGMTVLDDWFLGSLAGQVTLAFFGVGGCAAVGLLAARLFSPAAGYWAAFVYATTPWIYRFNTIPYVEGALLCYAVLAVLAGLRCGGERRWTLVAGGLAGCAMACKYPAVTTIAVPVAALVLWARRHEPGRAMAAFVLGAALFIGPWLVRNTLWTGNPLYPLAYQIFGGSGWSAAKAERFDRHHRPGDHRLMPLIGYACDVAARSDWQSALVFGFAPLAMVGGQRRRASALWLIVVYQFLAFWGLTHRLDRFWLPLEPFAAVLAGAGIVWNRGTVWRVLAIGCCSLAGLYNLAYCTTGLCGLPNYTADLRVQWHDNLRAQPALAVANDARFVPPGATVLYVGNAAVHDSVPRARYNTVFDDNLFVNFVADPAGRDTLRPADEIRTLLRAEGIAYVLVDWSEVARYRKPGNYGFAEFVQPAVFADLARLGTLEKVYLPHRFPRIVVWKRDPRGDPELAAPIEPSLAADLGDSIATAPAVELFRVAPVGDAR